MSEPNTNSRPHKTLTVTVGEWSEEIVNDIAPLIREMWIAGIDTLMSCQEVSPGIAWIEFPDHEELLQFLNLVTRYDPGIDTLYNRVNQRQVGLMSSPAWEYQSNLWDRFEDQEVPLNEGLGRFDAFVGVYFPITDIALLVERLQALNAMGSSPETISTAT